MIKLASNGKARKLRKRNACILFENKGFTFLNMLFSLSIVVIIVSSSAILIPYLYGISERENDLNLLEWEVFLQQTVIEMREGTNLTVEPQRISFTSKSGRVIEYEKYGFLIRRQVDGTGHIICLRNVKTVKFEPIAGGASLTVTSMTDNEYRFSLRNFHELMAMK
ncbi:competence type IV pilus minor pilin ComGF [Metabacillus idriensis]|uniref:competence type IV pilus minor pilin ComGF n=1 Tax=Metabacillus idriensis TaxID=324768 RepID=UPI0028135DF8|nr:competence type IV pilus minor pilin ComGF [Metabacillus idriensis]MDR0138386.1 competence type IV pilus minor pilin ComGF [Metabacillus idriensis]